MNEKAGVASSQDYGKDEKSVQKLIAKHNALMTDVESYSSVIDDLAKEGKRLMQAEHFDLANIKARQVNWREFTGCIKKVGKGGRYPIFYDHDMPYLNYVPVRKNMEHTTK